MKSTYKILSIYLDKMPLPMKIPEFINTVDIPLCFDIGADYNLFDYPICRRKVSGMKILSSENESEILNTLSHLVNCRELIILLDFDSQASIAQKLFLKRILQVARLITNHYPKIHITLATDKSNWKEIACDLYQTQ